MDVVYVLGTRPELIRSAPILRAIGADPSTALTVVNTGQHFDHNMSQGFVDYFNLPTPQYILEFGGMPRAEQVSGIISSLTPIFRSRSPACVCVFGDTNSCLGAALAAQMSDVPVVHIEAGARSYDMSLPEEVNRRVIDHIADLLLTVSQRCTQNLLKEAVRGAVVETGDPLFEALSAALSSAAPECRRREDQCLLTLHRQALVDAPSELLGQLEVIDDASGSLGLRTVFPVHPRTAKSISSSTFANIELRDPLLYEPLVELLTRSRLVITDSGGLQKEAFWTGTPCVTVRDSTEWSETIDLGGNVLATGPDVATAMKAMVQANFKAPAPETDPFSGLGASRRIADEILARYG